MSFCRKGILEEKDDFDLDKVELNQLPKYQNDTAVKELTKFCDQPFVEITRKFLKHDKKAEMDLILRSLFINRKDKIELENFCHSYFSGKLKKSNQSCHSMQARDVTLLGLIHFKGVGVKQNMLEALRYFHLAREKFDPFASYMIGIIYLVDRNIGANEPYFFINDPKVFFQEAKEYGLIAASFLLHYLCCLDDEISAAKFKDIAEHGDPRAWRFYIAFVNECDKPLTINEIIDFYKLAISGGDLAAVDGAVKTILDSKSHQHLWSLAIYYLRIASEHNTDQAQRRLQMIAKTTNESNVNSAFYHAAIVDNLISDKKDPELRNKFNALRIKNPDLFYHLIKESNDSMETILPLITLSKDEIDMIKVIEDVFFMLFNRSLIHLVNSYVFPLQLNCQFIQKNEQCASTASLSQYTIFNEARLTVTQNTGQEEGISNCSHSTKNSNI